MRPLTALAAAASAVLLMTPVSAWAIDARFLDGMWTGSYTCNGQETFLQLELDGDRNGKVTGTFQFGPMTGQSGPEGAYDIEGTIEENWFMELFGTGWIQQPEGFRMVDLRGVVQEGGGVWSGSVVDAACTSFYVKRR